MVNCPKCGSTDILIGTKEQPHHCSDCGFEWYPGEEPRKPPRRKSTGQARSESILAFKSPHILITINQNMKRNRLSDRLDDVLNDTDD